MSHGTKEWCKTWRKTDMLGVIKILKVCALIGSFSAKYITFDLKQYRGVIDHDIDEWWKIWGKTKLWFEKWLEEFGKFSPEQLKVSKLGLWWDPFVQSRKCMSWEFTEELCAIKLKNDAKYDKE